MDSAGGDTVEWARQDPNIQEGKDKERQERQGAGKEQGRPC